MEAKATEIKPEKRYVFQFPEGLSQEEANHVYTRLLMKGFNDPVIVAGDIKIFEL